MDRFEVQPQEGSERGEAVESTETRALDDATFEPVAYIEQAGDFKQAEVIQSSLEAVMATLTTERTQDGALPGKPEQRDASDVTEGTGKEPGGEEAIPITVPGVRTDAEAVRWSPIPLPRPEEGMPGQDSHQEGPLETAGEDADAVMATLTTERTHDGALPGKPEQRDADDVTEGTGKEPGGEEAIPITVPGVRTEAEEVSSLPLPIPHPEVDMPERDSRQEGPFETTEEDDDDRDNITPINLPGVQSTAEDEIVARGTVKGTEGTAEMPLPGTVSEEIGFKFHTKELGGAVEMPLPGTAGEIGAKGTVKGTEGAAEMPLPGTASAEGLTEGTAIDQVIARTESAIQEMSQSFNQQYLQLQQKMQGENRRFTLMSNIMKTKHDTAKNSINNIR